MKAFKKPELGLKKRSFRAGGYSFTAAAIVIAIAVFANLFVCALPESVTKLDVTSDSLYSLSAQTQNIVAALDDDITIYWIVQQGREDSMLETLLGRYEALSRKVSVVKKDPDVYPTFVQQYTSGGVTNNSLIIVSGTRSRYLSYNDIYQVDYSSYYSTGSYTLNFAGESGITSAIDYVTSETIPVLYSLSGHGESELSSSFSSAIEGENIEVRSLSLVTENAVPEDAAGVLIYAPQRDISEEEKELLLAYMEQGGSILLITDPSASGETRENLEALSEAFGMEETEGIVLEGDGNHYGFGMPYYLVPDFSSHSIVSPLSEGGYYVLLPIAGGLTLTGEGNEAYTVSSLLTTSDSAYSKLSGYEMTTYEKEDGDIDGPFVLAAIAEQSTEDGVSCFIRISSASILEDTPNLQVSGGNEDFFLNCLSYFCGEESSISIRAKSVSYEYLTMTSAQSSRLSMVFVVLIPLCCLMTGIVIRVRRKKR